VKFEVITVVSIKINIFLDVMPCRLEMFTNIQGSLGLKMEAACSSKVLVKFHQTTWHHIPEDSDFQHIKNCTLANM
jgi:hypothetical protein